MNKMMKKHYKLINNLLTGFIGGSLVLFVFLRILFPRFDYFLNKADQYKIQLEKISLEDKFYLKISPLKDYEYKTVKLKLPKNSSLSRSSQELPVFKDFIVNFYPQGEVIEKIEDLLLFVYSDGEIANGSLFSYKGAVFVYSRGKYLPFLGPEVFEKLGYSWNNVLNIDAKKLSSFVEGDKITFASVHPDGTLIERSNEEFFLVWQGQLLPIKKGLLAFLNQEVGIIKLKDKSTKQFTSCLIEMKKNKFQNICFFNKKMDNFFNNGPSYLIELSQGDWEKIDEAKITFETFGGGNWIIARDSLSQIKRRLIERYSNEFKL